MIAAGVTRIEPDKMTEILTEAAAGTAPSTIARQLNVGYSTVGRILDEARQ
jgi:hypothetical protein